MRLYGCSGSGSGSGFVNMLVAFVGSMMLGASCSHVAAQGFAGPSPLYLNDFSTGVVSNKLLTIEGGQPTKIPNTWPRVVVGESTGHGSMNVNISSRFFYDSVSSTIRQLWAGDSTSYICFDSAGDKNQLIIGQCLFNDNQKFEVNPVGSPIISPGSLYVTVQFKLKANGYCLDYDYDIGTQIKLKPCNTNSQTQRFYVPTYIPANTAFSWYDPSPVYAAPLDVVSSSRFDIGGPFNGPNWANIVLTQATVSSSVLFEYVNNTSQIRQSGSSSCIDSAGDQNRLIFGQCLGNNGNQIIDIIPLTTTGLIKIKLRANGYCADYTTKQPNEGQIVKFKQCDINSQTQTFYVPTYRTSKI